MDQNTEALRERARALMQEVESRVPESRRKEVSAYCNLQAAVDILRDIESSPNSDRQRTLDHVGDLVDGAENYLQGETYLSWLKELDRRLGENPNA